MILFCQLNEVLRFKKQSATGYRSSVLCATFRKGENGKVPHLLFSLNYSSAENFDLQLSLSLPFLPQYQCMHYMKLKMQSCPQCLLVGIQEPTEKSNVNNVLLTNVEVDETFMNLSINLGADMPKFQMLRLSEEQLLPPK